LSFSAKEGLFNICELFLEKLKYLDVEFYKKIIEEEDEILGKTILMEILPKIKNVEKFSSFLDDIFEFYGENILEKFLLREDDEGNTILHLMTEKNVNIKNFENFMQKIKTKLDEDNLKKLFLHKNRQEASFLHFSIKNSKNSKILQKSFEFIRKSFSSDEVKSFLKSKCKDGTNILHMLIHQEKKVSVIIFDFVGNFLERKEFQELLEKKDERGHEALQLAALNVDSKENFEFLFKKISVIVENPKNFLTKMGKYDRSILHLSLENKKSSEVFASCFNLMGKFFESKREFQSFIAKKTSEDENLLTLAAAHAPKSILEFLIEKFTEMYDTKSFLKTTKGKFKRNLLSLAAINKNLESLVCLWTILEQTFSRQILLEFLAEKDEDEHNVLHIFAMFSISERNFKFLWSKLEHFFDNRDDLKNYLTIKGFSGRSILLQSVVERNEESFNFIYKNIYCKFFDYKNFLTECEASGENFLHYIARFGSAQMIQHVIEDAKTKLSLQDLKQLIRIRTKKFHYNILHCAALNNTSEHSIKYLFIMIKKYFNEAEIRETLMAEDKYKYYPLDSVVERNKINIFELFAKFYKENLTEKENKKIFKRKVLVELAKRNLNEKSMRDFIEKHFDKRKSNEGNFFVICFKFIMLMILIVSVFVVVLYFRNYEMFACHFFQMIQNLSKFTKEK
jgi:hypothetical protein